MKNGKRVIFMIFLILFCSLSKAVESGMYRLLSVSKSEKLIVVSNIPAKTRHIFDVAAAKITIDDKPSELGELKSYSLIQIKLDPQKMKRKGIEIDGKAIEIRVSSKGTPSD